MSGTHPFPLSDHRSSYPSQDSSPAYPPAPATSSYAYPQYPSRTPNYEASHGRVDPATAASISGMFHHQEDSPQQHYPRPGYSGDAFSHPPPHSESREQLWQYSAPPTEGFRPRLDQQQHDVGVPSEYQLPMSHGQPVTSSSHGPNMSTSVQPSSVRPGASGSSGGRSRREKPRLELAPDQPLTTQGKPRTRVYVACVQCRGRKIRCDGAKPVCHNCSRRTENPNQCTYDTAPKRRGPDRVPGARQRSAGGPAEKPRRRRRPPPIESAGHTLESPQSASTSPIDYKSISYSPTGHPYMTEHAGVHPEGLTIIHGAMTALSSRTGRSTRTPQAAAYEANPLGSPLSDMPQLVGYAVGVPVSLPPPLGLAGSEEEYEYGEGGAGGSEHKAVIAPDPGLQFTRETWWDALLVLYATEGNENTTQNITADLRAIFRASPYWLNFINLPRFFGSLLDPRARHGIQPSLILGALALSTFFRSHEGELGARGRARALKLRDQAQSALEASLSSRWIDHSLVQAAWLIAFFEICAHPLHSTARVCSSMGMLDSLLRSMGLLLIDAEDPRVSIFTSSVPSVADASAPRLDPLYSDELSLQAHNGGRLDPLAIANNPTQVAQQWQLEQPLSPLATRPLAPLQSPIYTNPLGGEAFPMPPPETQSPEQQLSAFHGHTEQQTQSLARSESCSCMSFTLGHTWPVVHEYAPLWDMTPTWQSQWTESEIRKEECRRLVWSSVMLTAGHSSYTAASPELHVQQLYLMDPRNYALLFPGESLTYTDGSGDPSAVKPPDKDSVWALYVRAMLMWNSCIRVRADTTMPDAEKAQFALAAWREIDAIEEALKRHTCGIERSFLFQGRELLFKHANLLFYRKKADEWLTHLASLAKRMLNAGLPSVTGLPAASLAKRPFLLFWFMSQMERYVAVVELCTAAFMCLTVPLVFRPRRPTLICTRLAYLSSDAPRDSLVPTRAQRNGSRSLTLWSYDRSLSLALDVAKALSRPVQYLMSLWPCPEQRRRWEDLHQKLISSCYAAGIPLANPNTARTPSIQEIPVILTQS
ncbi:hypothetical protein ONZ51_g330 [Trametes cubensis]|uniref:Zn(2)-C6 fungal-type domain-containing protein n=1 Tax=Trametes cubensis TaxID=1111947 RepID=A0AAD7U3Q0_9APHY|nr:hypothetical protein ONZ51_g330 [Trametes cubensis]